MLQCNPSQQNGDHSSSLLVINRSEINAAYAGHLHLIGVIKSPPWESDLAPGYWVGGTDTEVEGVWRWSDTKKSVIPTRPDQPGFQKWYRQAGRNEPSNAVGDEDCLYISNLAHSATLPNLLGSWLSSNCLAKKFFICQANKPSKFESSLSLNISY